MQSERAYYCTQPDRQFHSRSCILYRLSNNSNNSRADYVPHLLTIHARLMRQCPPPNKRGQTKEMLRMHDNIYVQYSRFFFVCQIRGWTNRKVGLRERGQKGKLWKWTKKPYDDMIEFWLFRVRSHDRRPPPSQAIVHKNITTDHWSFPMFKIHAMHFRVCGWMLEAEKNEISPPSIPQGWKRCFEHCNIHYRIIFLCVCVSGKSEKNPFSSFYKENVTFSAPREFDMRKSCYWGGGVARISALRLRTYFDWFFDCVICHFKTKGKLI